MIDRIPSCLFADIMGVSKKTLDLWKKNGKYRFYKESNGGEFLLTKDLFEVPEISEMMSGKWEEEMKIKPHRAYRSIELFAGAGGLAIGMEKAGFQHVMLNEIDHYACQTLLRNRPEWHVAEGDVRKLDFSIYSGKIDLMTGGFPC